MTAPVPTTWQTSLELKPGVRLTLRQVPAGAFWMGSSRAELEPLFLAFPTERPWLLPEMNRHRVELPAYWIGRTPVTVAQFAAFVQETAYQTEAEREGGGQVAAAAGHWATVSGAIWSAPRGAGTTTLHKQDHPVTQVSWFDAVAYCAWASEKSGRVITLPSEAEWEKAARGPEGRRYPWGEAEPTEQLANFGGAVSDTTPVSRYSPAGDSVYGCTDMAGNVLEWTRSLGDWDYPYRPDDGREDQAPSAARAQRGGAFYLSARSLRAAARFSSMPHSRTWLGGFRVVCQSFPAQP